ncbi:MAG TPA: sigma-70 family RNA polymerase sigma factor [Bryocella sp.]|nr:sigma-70 family RNA polymerase sigma factor [Bryocella sp.]
MDVADPLQHEAAPVIPAPESQLIQELYTSCEAAGLGWTLDEFGAMIRAAASRRPEGASTATYLRGLHIEDLALAQACARGYERAWDQLIKSFRGPLRQAAIAISKSSSIGEELADSVYADLFGLKNCDSERRSPLASYSGRGSLMGWLRATLAQHYVDRFRRTHREAPLEETDVPAPAGSSPPVEDALRLRLESTIHVTLRSLEPQDRFLLASYFLDGRTLLEIGRLLRVHEATVSRKLRRLTESIRKQLLRELQHRGLKKTAAEEALGVDPGDLNLNLRKILQTGTGPPFSEKDAHKRQNE